MQDYEFLLKDAWKPISHHLLAFLNLSYAHFEQFQNLLQTFFEAIYTPKTVAVSFIFNFNTFSKLRYIEVKVTLYRVTLHRGCFISRLPYIEV